MLHALRHSLKPNKRRVPIYAESLSEGTGSPTFSNSVAGGVSPGWTMADGARVGLNADLMVPYDWLKGSDIKFYFVYAPTTVGGVGNAVWGIDYVLYPDDKYGGGLGLNPARTVRVTVDTPPFGVVMKTTDNPVAIPGRDLVGKRQIQIAFIRAGDLAEDTDNRSYYLIKVIMEYEAYEP
jgi:hypothetical protein